MENDSISCKNILIIEDEKQIREALAALLEIEGYHVFSAINGREGLELLQKIPKPCLILLDFMMPVMNGQEFLEAKAQDNRIARIPVVIVSAYEDRARTLQASGFLKKPIHFDGLLRFVKKYCDQFSEKTVNHESAS